MNVHQEQQPEHPEWSDAALDAEPVLSRRALHRLGWVIVAILLVALLTVLPPLLNVNRYQRRVAQGISASIGRPVHFDQIHLHLLPLPGLTIQNFVVEEDPAFGTEPALRANTVEARLRLASLWRRRVEVSHIKLLAPSINLVRRSDGRWSLQGIVTQAGYLQSAPTVQGSAGPAARFPYIEATDARINIKSGQTKLPWSLLDARLALWLPDQTEWRVRLRGRPLRTDTDVSDVGELELEGSLGRGNPGGTVNQPLAIAAHWASTPLGEAAKLFVGRDTGFRGAASAELEIRGTPAHMQLSSDMHLHNLRRAEFVPRLPMSVNAHCQADAMGIIHALHNVRCAVPTAQSDDLFGAVFRSGDEPVLSAPDVLTLQAEVPDLLSPASARATVTLKKAKPDYFLNWLRVFSSRIPEAETIDGSVALAGSYDSPETGWSLSAMCLCSLPAQKALQTAATTPDVPAPTSEPWSLQFTHAAAAHTVDRPASPTLSDVLSIKASPLPQGTTLDTAPDAPRTASSAQPAAISGEISRSGAMLTYDSVRLASHAAELLPPLADDMPSLWTTPSAPATPVRSQRAWGQLQIWSAAAPAAPLAKPRKRSHR